MSGRAVGPPDRALSRPGGPPHAAMAVFARPAFPSPTGVPPCMRRAALCSLVILSAALAACAGQAGPERSAQTPLQREIAQVLYAAILDQAPTYRALTRRKVLAACIDWGHGAGGYVDVYFTSAYYEAEYSERGAAAALSRLMNLALADCERTRAEADLECQCQEVDHDGRNVLSVPDRYSGELTARR